MPTNIPVTQLDPGQIVKGAYDEAERRIRVDANITAPDGSSILIDATTDSIKIGNTATGPFLNINPDGSINVNDSGSGTANASVGLTGVTAPTYGTEIGGIDPNGLLKGLLVDNSGALIVNSSGTSVVTGTVTTEQAGLNIFQTSQYSIGNTAVQLVPVALINRSSVSIKVLASPNIAVWIGENSSVTIGSGYPLYNGDSLQLDLTPNGQIWAICNTPTQTIAALEIA